MASNTYTTSKASLVAQTPPVTKTRRVVKPSTPKEKVYSVGDKAVIHGVPKRVGTILELTQFGYTSAKIKIDTDGSIVNAVLNITEDMWYLKRTATLFFPGMPEAIVTLAHERFPETIEAPKAVPREALGLPPAPAAPSWMRTTQ